uniref:Uncharacterized protein n=1 Tax=viral metagenome TaxID=1070528 RepID=A0A2V0RBL9_9ZZZZ
MDVQEAIYNVSKQTKIHTTGGLGVDCDDLGYVSIRTLDGVECVRLCHTGADLPVNMWMPQQRLLLTIEVDGGVVKVFSTSTTLPALDQLSEEIGFFLAETSDAGFNVLSRGTFLRTKRSCTVHVRNSVDVIRLDPSGYGPLQWKHFLSCPIQQSAGEVITIDRHHDRMKFPNFSLDLSTQIDMFNLNNANIMNRGNAPLTEAELAFYAKLLSKVDQRLIQQIALLGKMDALEAKKVCGRFQTHVGSFDFHALGMFIADFFANLEAPVTVESYTTYLAGWWLKTFELEPKKAEGEPTGAMRFFRCLHTTLTSYHRDLAHALTELKNHMVDPESSTPVVIIDINGEEYTNEEIQEKLGAAYESFVLVAGDEESHLVGYSGDDLKGGIAILEERLSSTEERLNAVRASPLSSWSKGPPKQMVRDHVEAVVAPTVEAAPAPAMEASKKKAEPAKVEKAKPKAAAKPPKEVTPPPEAGPAEPTRDETAAALAKSIRDLLDASDGPMTANEIAKALGYTSAKPINQIVTKDQTLFRSKRGSKYAYTTEKAEDPVADDELPKEALPPVKVQPATPKAKSKGLSKTALSRAAKQALEQFKGKQFAFTKEGEPLDDPIAVRDANNLVIEVEQAVHATTNETQGGKPIGRTLTFVHGDQRFTPRVVFGSDDASHVLVEFASEAAGPKMTAGLMLNSPDDDRHASNTTSIHVTYESQTVTTAIVKAGTSLLKRFYGKMIADSLEDEGDEWHQAWEPDIAYEQIAGDATAALTIVSDHSA